MLPKGIARLTVPKSKAAELIQKQIDAGKLLASVTANSLTSNERLDDWMNDTTRWVNYTGTMLLRSFDVDAPSVNFREAGEYGVSVATSDVLEIVTDHRGYIKSKLNSLVSIMEQLELLDDVVEPTTTTDLKVPKPTSRKVFVVHGHDIDLRNETEILLRKLELRPIVLGEQASGGKTVIEKIEDYSEVWFAIVLMSADDTGVSRSDWGNNGEAAVKYRARQNVVLELGYFVALLTRKNVCVVYKSDDKKEFELPSDIQGVVYIRYQSRQQLENDLAKELVRAGKRDNVLVNPDKLFAQ